MAMARIYDSLSDLIGDTPLLRLQRVAPEFEGEILAKLELMNPSGSDKDRVARAMLEAAEASGDLTDETVIVEVTSGNLGFSLAVLAVPRGYRLVLVMPDNVPIWRIELLRAIGAEVVLSPASQGMHGAEVRAAAVARRYPSVFRPDQFSNPANPQSHEQSGDEIWQACEGTLAALVAGVGTGGAVTGIGRRLKQLSGGRVRVIAVEPAASPVLSGGRPGAHTLHGLGPPFVPANYDSGAVDEVVTVSDFDCREMMMHLFRAEGLLTGPGGAAAVAAALRLATRPVLAGKRIVCVIPDRIERYADVELWARRELLMPVDQP
jgi:cysteine synthase